MTKCKDCGDLGYVRSNNELGEDEVQKCDSCNKFITDEQAKKVAGENDDEK